VDEMTEQRTCDCCGRSVEVVGEGNLSSLGWIGSYGGNLYCLDVKLMA
jgi:hypothetical protein